MAARAGGRVGGVNYAWSPTYVPIGPVPALASVTNPIVSGSPFVITGTDFETPQGAGFARLIQGSTVVELTESAWSDTEITAAAIDVFATTLAFGAVTARVENDTGNAGTRAGTLHPPANVAYFTLAAINTTAEYRLSGTPALQVGEQIAYGTFLYTDSTCETITAYYVVTDDAMDGSLEIDVDAPNGTYYVPTWRKRLDTGVWEYAVQTIVIDVVRVGSLAAMDAESDSAAFTGTVPVQGALAATEESDTAEFGGNVRVQGTLAATEQSDTASITGTVQILGGMAATDAPADSARFTGTVSGAVETDTTPDPIAFPPQPNAALNAAITFAPQIVTGITAPVTITATGGAEYRIGDGEWTSAPGTVSSGNVVTPRVTSPNTYSTQLTPVPTLVIGGITCPLVCITGAQPTTVAEIMVQRDTAGVTAAVTSDSKLIVTITDMPTFLKTAKRR